jgi:U3 small nucleolar RNA-associated protein 6
MAGHIKALMAASGEAPAKVIKTAARYTSQVPQSSRVWLARLAAEKAVGTGTGARDAWGEARKLARGSEEEMVRVWTWGVEEQRMHEASGADLGKRMDAICAQLEELLRESMQASLHGVHEVLLENYVTVLEEANNEPEAGRTSDQGRGWSSWKATVGHMGRQCLTSGPFWERVFERVAKMEAKDAGGKEGVLRAIYEEWRKKDGVGAVVGWAGWLLGTGRGREATEIVTAASASSAEVRARWIAICSV